MFNVYIVFYTVFVVVLHQLRAVNCPCVHPFEVVKADAKLALKRISYDVEHRRFVDLDQGIDSGKLAPFKIKFHRMSKSDSLNRSNSTETDHDLLKSSPKDPPTASSILKEGNENETTEEDGYIADVSSNKSNSNQSSNNEAHSNDNDYGVGREARLKQQKSQPQSPTTPPKAPEIMHKSSKEFYKAVAKQFGITCKMSDHCRCYDCQSHYFDCEYEQNEQEKTDGGLGAGTPVFLHEVMHGSACTIL